ncbi:MAG: hypothetical protein WD751_03570 [Anaerolineales bacterium]
MITPNTPIKKTIDKGSLLRIAVFALITILIGLSAFLGISLLNAQRETDELSLSLTDLVVYSQQTNDKLATAEASLTALNQDYQVLQGDLDQLTLEKQEVETRASLYQAQRYYLAEALDWVGRQYGYTDPMVAARAYGSAKGQALPVSCEAETADRYVRWAAPTSTMFVVTPTKMGWSPYVGWSIRENVVFGPEHVDAPGYVGSRGYEFRYPLMGTLPLQEIHTTINVFQQSVSQSEGIPTDAIQQVALHCGVTGYLTTSTDRDQTKTLHFNMGGFKANVKLKYFSGDIGQAITYLTQAANIVIDELVSGF